MLLCGFPFMLSIIELGQNHKITRPKLDKMDFHHTKWLDVANPTDEDLHKVCKTCKLPFREVKRFIDKEELPRVTTLGHFTVIVFKAPLQEANREHVSSTSMAFLISERLLITLHQEEITPLSELLESPNDFLQPLFSRGPAAIFGEIVERLVRSFFAKLDTVEERIDKVEDQVFSNPETATVKKVFSLKRTLIYFHKALSADRDVLVALHKEGGVLEDVSQHLMQQYYDVVQLLDVVATYRDILTGTLDIYLSTVSNNMNAVMKKMAAYGTLVLVPTFITGLYGMNFRFLPEVEWKYGYLFAWGLIVFSVAALWFYFRRKEWF